MRLVLISALCLSLLAGCSNIQIGHRIDVQQGNALDPENGARLKPGLSRSQVRFLLGTPLLVDPFRTDRWDYVYLFYQAGTLVERKRVSLIFEGDTLVRIEGDVPAEVLATPVPNAAPAVPASPLPEPEPVVSPAVAPAPPPPSAVDGSLSAPPEARP